MTRVKSASSRRGVVIDDGVPAPLAPLDVLATYLTSVEVAPGGPDTRDDTAVDAK